MPRIFECEHCGNPANADDGCEEYDGGLVCNSCLVNDKVVECEWCEELCDAELMVEDTQGNLVCKDCGDSFRADYMHDQYENYVDMEENND